MHGSFEFVGVDAEDVSVDVGVEHHGVLFDDRLQHLDLITQPGRLFEFEFGAGRLHLSRKLRDVRFADSTGEHTDKLFAHCTMFIHADASDAWRRTFADGGQQTWPVRDFGLVVDALRTGADGERLQQSVETVPQVPYFRIGAEISGVTTLAAAGDPYAGNPFP